LLDPVELVGYLWALLVVTSLAMTSVVRLRLISLAGSLAYVVYGLLLPAVPIVLANGVIAALNIWYLSREFLSSGRRLGAVPIAVDQPFLQDFLDSHDADLRRFQPSFTLEGKDAAWLLTREGLPAGVLIGRRAGSDLLVDLDYVTARYRDSQLGRWLYGPGSKVLRAGGVQRVVSEPGTPEHRRYLVAMGFTESDGRMVRPLA